jgi:hypothetical protein
MEKITVNKSSKNGFFNHLYDKNTVYSIMHYKFIPENIMGVLKTNETQK